MTYGLKIKVIFLDRKNKYIKLKKDFSSFFRRIISVVGTKTSTRTRAEKYRGMTYGLKIKVIFLDRKNRSIKMKKEQST